MVDTSNIEGYEKMTPEQKVAALEALDIPSREGMIDKRQFDKVASELAAKKKELAAKQTADEQAAEAAMEAQKAKDEQLAALQKQVAKYDNKAKFLSIGFSEKDADKSAADLADAKLDDVFKAIAENINSQKSQLEKSIKAELLNRMPEPEKGSPSTTLTKEDFAKMTLSERNELFTKDKATYDKLQGEITNG